MNPLRDGEQRYSLYRLCECAACGGSGKERVDTSSAGGRSFKWERCKECRGEGRVRQELAGCDSPEAVGVALVTLAREGEWTDANGQPCALGLLDRLPEGKDTGTWLIRPWFASARNVTDAARTLARSKSKPSTD